MWRKFFFVVIHVYIKTFLLTVMTYMTPLTVLTVTYKWISWEMRGWKYTDVSLAICSSYRSFGGWQVINFSALDADIGGVWRIANCFTGLGRGYWGNALWVTVGGFPKIRDFSRKNSALLLPGALCMAMLLHARMNGDDRFINSFCCCFFEMVLRSCDLSTKFMNDIGGIVSPCNIPCIHCCIGG